MRRASLKLNAFIIVLAMAGMASAANWTGGGGPGEPYWDIAQNWSNNAVPVAGDGVNVNTVMAQDGITPLNPMIDRLVTDAQCLSLYVGNNGSGVLDMVGGKLTVGQWFQVGVNGGTGVLNLSDGDVICSTQILIFGQSAGHGTLNMHGGSISLEGASKHLFLGYDAAGAGVINMDGGTLNVQDLVLGQLGKGSMRMAGGQINATGWLQVPNAGSTGTLEFFGGTIEVGGRLVMRGVGKSLIDLSGGTIILGLDTGMQSYIDSGQIIAYGGAGTVNVEVVDGKWVLTGTADAEVMARARLQSPKEAETLFGNQAALVWIAGKGADSHRVYMGTDPAALELLTTDPNQGVLSIDFHTTATDLDLGTTYYWRVDEVIDANAAEGIEASVTTGDVWSFATVPLEMARPVSPLHEATGAEITDLVLQWEPGLGAINHDVYFGTDAANLALVSEDQTEPAYTVPEVLIKGQTYYWRVDEFDGNDLYTGLVLSFKTTAPSGTSVFTDGETNDSLWSSPGNWSAGLPGIGTNARIINALGPCEVNAGTAAYCTKLELGWDNPDAHCQLNVTGGSLTIEDELLLCRMLGGVATLRISGGVVNTGFVRGWHGDMWIQMTGGELNMAGTLEIPRGYAADVGTSGVFKLWGGVTRAGDLTLNGNANVVCVLDIKEGVLILDGDKTSKIANYVASGLITGYDGAGSVSVNYDLINPGKTTITACANVFRANFNGDCVVDELDRDLLMSEWGYQTPAGTLWDFDMSTDPVGSAPYDLKIRDAANGNYMMIADPGTLSVQGGLLLDEQLDAVGLWDTDLHFVAQAMSLTPLNLWVTMGTSASPSSQAYVGLSLSLDTATNTQTLQLWNGNPPHIPPFEAVVATGFAADAMVDITMNYDYDTDTYDWTATDGTLTRSGKGVPYAAFNGGDGGAFTIQGVNGTIATIDQLTFKVHGSGIYSPYDINLDGTVDQLDLDILESEMGK